MAAPDFTLTVTTDRNEYSRFESDKQKVTVKIVPVGTNYNFKVVTVTLRKARRARDEVVGTMTCTLTTGNTSTVEFDLKAITDSNFIPKVRRGSYYIRADYTDNLGAANAVSDDFSVSLITTDLLKKKYLYGTDQRAFEVKGAKTQPSAITGVSIEEVSKSHPGGWFNLTYSFSYGMNKATDSAYETGTVFTGSTATDIIFTAPVPVTITEDLVVGKVLIIGGEKRNIIAYDGNTGTATVHAPYSSAPVNTTPFSIYQNYPVRLLTWSGGSAVSLSDSTSSYLLRKGTTADYITVAVPDVTALPEVTTTEEILIESAVLSQDKLKSFIDKAADWVEKTAIKVFLEPTKIVTEYDDTTATLVSGSTDIYEYSGATFDEIVDACTYFRPNPNHWMSFSFPYRPLLKFDSLYGKTANVQIINIDLNWVEFHSKGGLVELVPFQSQSQFNFLGLLWVNAVHGPMPIPNFWNFKATVGFRETPDVLLDLVGKQAAIEALTVAGQAYRGGLGSSSISRDGVSEGVSYLSGGQFGTYSGTIAVFQKWIDDNLPRIRQTFLGPNMVVMN